MSTTAKKAAAPAGAAAAETVPDAAPADPEPASKPAAVTTKDTAALAGVTSGRTKPGRPRRVIVSEGVKHDLKRLGKVIDPGTGYELRRNEKSGKVTAHDRATGELVNIPVV